jgi:dihydrofolate reductase
VSLERTPAAANTPDTGDLGNTAAGRLTEHTRQTAHGAPETAYPLSIVVAMAENRVIGRNGALPWHLPEDLARFKKTTMGGALIMGSRTWRSIGQPLPGRISIVLSSRMPEPEGAIVCRSLEEAIRRGRGTGRELFCIGGASVFAQALPFARRMYLSLVPGEYEGDTYFPEFSPQDWTVTHTEKLQTFTLFIYERRIV